MESNLHPNPPPLHPAPIQEEDNMTRPCIASRDVWPTLTGQQQQRLFLTLVRLCGEISATRPPEEGSHEPT
ncbi:MAG: hypothetical protein M1546_02555 [Chloroflexi bacterium]|nr:hypothetical protein [Chloroflexota bacterium]